MGKCSGPCDSYTGAAIDPIWFKIDQYGYENGKWASDIAQDGIWKSTIPADVEPG